MTPRLVGGIAMSENGGKLGPIYNFEFYDGAVGSGSGEWAVGKLGNEQWAVADGMGRGNGQRE